MDYIWRFFRFPERKSAQELRPDKKVEKLSDQSTSNAESEPADKEKRLNEESNWTSIDAYLRRLFGFSERKSAQKRKREEKDETLPDRSTSNAESEPVGKKKRLNEETNGFSVDAVQCRICLDVVSCSVMRSLPCAHVFHENCLFQWLEISEVCPLCKWPTTENTFVIDLIWLWETSENNEDGTNGNEYQPGSHESASDGFSEFPPDGSSNETPPDGSSGKPSPDGSSCKSPQDGLSGESPPGGSNGQSLPDGSNGESKLDRSNGETTQDESNGESSADGSSDKSPSVKSNGESPVDGSSGESPPDGLSGESPPGKSNGESTMDRSSGETMQDGSSDNAQSDGWKGESPRMDAVMVTVESM